MAMYDVKFKSFKEIEAYWRGVKPIRGRKEDVRPIADRARHWERVNKLSDTCYSMSLSFWNGEIQNVIKWELVSGCLLYTSPSPRDPIGSRMPSSA